MLRDAARSSVNALVWCAILGVFRSLLETYGVHRFQRILDDLAAGALTMTAVVVFGVVVVTANIIAYADEGPKTRALQQLYYHFKIESIRKASRVSFERVMGVGTGTLLQQIEAGAIAGRQIIFDFWMRTIREIAPDVVFGLLFIALLDWRVALGVIAGYLVLFGITNLVVARLYDLKYDAVVDDELINRRVARAIMELATFRVLGLFSKELREVQSRARANTERSIRLVLTHEFLFAFFAALMNLVKVAVIALFAAGVIDLSVGALVALLLYMDRVYNPIAIFDVIYVQYRLDAVTFRRLNDYFELPDDANLVQDGHRRQRVLEPSSLAMENASLVMGGRALLTDINLEVNRGESVAIVGASGSGKSTALRMMLGLLKSSSGLVTVDGVSLADTDLQSFYDSVAYLAQDPPIFDGTIRENLMVPEGVSEPEVLRALEAAGLGEFIAEREGGLDSEIGERGIQVSGGEKQRIALTRVLLSPKPFVILDEATSALDAPTEERVLRALHRYRSTTATVVVAHRLRTIREIDRVYMLDNGSVVETGAPNDLIRADGAFALLWQEVRKTHSEHFGNSPESLRPSDGGDVPFIRRTW